jgi:SAM-dependent methyltransferase
MTTSFYAAYGALADIGADATEQAGRLPSQVRAERLIIADLEAKLALAPPSRLLEIGCGPGNLLIPLSFRVERAVGIDHPGVIARARARYQARNVEWIAGEFPNVRVEGQFDAILMYSVLQYQVGMDAAIAFCERAAAMLPSGGRLLIGDMPNVDRKRRFLASDFGKAFEAEWRSKQAVESQTPRKANLVDVFSGATSLGGFTDADVLHLLTHFRAAGLHTYVLPQPPDLPFGHTREDVLLVKP